MVRSCSYILTYQVSSFLFADRYKLNYSKVEFIAKSSKYQYYGLKYIYNKCTRHSLIRVGTLQQKAWYRGIGGGGGGVSEGFGL